MTPHAKNAGASVAQIRSVPATAGFVETAEQRLLDLWIKQQRRNGCRKRRNFQTLRKLRPRRTNRSKRKPRTLQCRLAASKTSIWPKRAWPGNSNCSDSHDSPRPHDRHAARRLSQITASLQRKRYGRAKWHPYGPSGECLPLNELENILAVSRDPRELLSV